VRSVTKPLTTKNFPLVILCGGKSSRMGKNKTFLPFCQFDSLIHFQYNRLYPFFENLFISSKQHNFNFLEENSTNIILDENKNIYSPLIGLKEILTKVNAPKVFILTVDTPFVSIQSIEKLIDKCTEYEITIAQTLNKTHNLCGVFSTSLLPKIEKMLEQDIHKIGYLIKQSHVQVVEFDNEEEFLNMNTKEEYEKALEILKRSI